MKTGETPLHHLPQVQSLDLATHAAVGDCWELFFVEALRLAEQIRTRRQAQVQAETPVHLEQTKPAA